MSGLTELAKLLAGESADTSAPPETLVETAVVTAVTAGAGKGGTSLVQVSWRGATVTAARLDTYVTPAVNDLVLLVHHGNTPFLLGRLTGQPV